MDNSLPAVQKLITAKATVLLEGNRTAALQEDGSIEIIVQNLNPPSVFGLGSFSPEDVQKLGDLIAKLTPVAETDTQDFGMDYLRFFPVHASGEPKVCIDGWFTAQQLRNIARELDRQATETEQTE